MIFSAVPSCPSRIVGLVYYPSTLAPDFGTKEELARCADNAHLVGSISLSVTCTSSGTWSGKIPECACDDGYREYTEYGRKICGGKNINFDYRNPVLHLDSTPFSNNLWT